jgi:hypothetical protein
VKHRFETYHGTVPIVKSSYSSSWGASQITTPITPSHLGLSLAWNKIDTFKLSDYSSVVSVEACVPLTVPLVKCQIVLDEPSIRVVDGETSYDTPCGTTKLTMGHSSQRGGAVTSICGAPDDEYLTMFYHTVVTEEADGGTRQLQCDIRIQEHTRRLRFLAGSSSLYQDTGDCGGTQIDLLTHAESRPLITSVVYVLQGAAQQLDQAVGSQRNPLYGLVDRAMIDVNFDRLELMVTNGIQIAASVLYGLGSNETSTVPKSGYMDAVVLYNAYSWGIGWKGEST